MILRWANEFTTGTEVEDSIVWVVGLAQHSFEPKLCPGWAAILLPLLQTRGFAMQGCCESTTIGVQGTICLDCSSNKASQVAWSKTDVLHTRVTAPRLERTGPIRGCTCVFDRSVQPALAALSRRDRKSRRK